jgi:hypothetical protein
MVNPYFCFVFGFLFAIVCYLFGWSDLYPPLSTQLLIFFAGVLSIFTIAGWQLNRLAIIRFQKIHQENFYPLVITIFIYVIWIIEFAYEGGIPLMKILLNQPYNYLLFGVPSLHVFAVTFSSFYTVYLFHLYRSEKNKVILFLFLVNLAAGILIYSRAMIIFNLSSCVAIYLIEIRRLSLRQIFIAMAGVFLIFYVFGVLGSLRVSRIAGKKYTNENFLSLGKATPSFRNSFIPSEYFWFYFYTSSPIANLQHNINTYPVKPTTVSTVLNWFNNEVVMDFASKRINTLTKAEREREHRIPGPFNATSIFSRSYSYLGWWGLLAMTVVLLIIPVLLIKVVPVHSPFFLTTVGLLCTIFLFAVYDNTIRFTGLSFQLAYPVLLHFACERLPWVKKIFVNNKVTCP